MSQKVSKETGSIDPSKNEGRPDGSDPHSVVYVRPKDVHLTITDLDDIERLVLWTMRVWVKGFMCDLSVEKSILTRLNRPNASEIYAEVEGLMSLYGRAARHPLDFRCPMCVSLSPDEYTFLLMISAAQAGIHDLVRAITEEGLNVSSTRCGALIAERLAAKLTIGGLVLSLKTYSYHGDSREESPAVIPFKRTLH